MLRWNTSARHDIAEILLKLASIENYQSINQSINQWNTYRITTVMKVQMVISPWVAVFDKLCHVEYIYSCHIYFDLILKYIKICPCALLNSHLY